ncbi:prepilin-type N-terminal cleavage/methylation domain-containing protein [Ruficoccus sp. ZRK36]|uniref:prepilin-type N-terminal cleavage/methylation domain-containing protein n=1 Tax=Ruficoccus sp. ZRK36 TaxID=2866311 RepID=UPI001C738EBF|nr:prepilin-type N-terminal cleavage/methylation domain-containing protein [Ruficoccus sp. ZRK36]QYY37279.1 prepilin-type N-terminal cleavage/methylation domain-containing protein [Ruficoccus sp. ZRK36]
MLITRPLKGFSLVELLVSIAVITILAAILIASTRAIRTHSHKTVSLSNLRSLQLANMTYANEHGGKYVPNVSRTETGYRPWYNNREFFAALGMDSENIGYYDVFKNMLDPLASSSEINRPDYIYRSYGYNTNGLSINWNDFSPDGYGWRVFDIDHPARTMAFATASDWIVGYGGRFRFFDDPNTSSNGAISYRYPTDMALLVYFDGHTGIITREDIEKIDTIGANNNIFWNPQGTYLEHF